MGKGSKIKHKKSKKERRHRRHSSSSDTSSDSDACEWVEKVVEIPQTKKEEKEEESSKKDNRDEWMNMDSVFPCISKDDLKKEKKKKEEEEKISAIIDAPGQSDREANPHWKNGGNGLPVENKKNCIKMDAFWLKKSLKRAEEYAKENGLSLEEVAESRWGSLDTIKNMIYEAEIQSDGTKNSKKYLSSVYDKYRGRNYDRNQYSEKRKRSRSRSCERSSSRNRYNESNKRDKRPSFKKPREDDNFHDKTSYTTSSQSSKNWKKPEFKKACEDNVECVQKSPSPKKEIKSQAPIDNEDDESILTEEEMNLLGAKLVKAEIMDKMELAAKLKSKLDKARKRRQQKSENKNENVVILTTTDDRGNMRYLNPRCERGETSNNQKKKIDTHDKGQRVRYFADDDKYSLQQMFHQEKGRSVVDDDAAFTKIMSKNADMDDIFEEQVRRGDSSAKQDARERMRAIKEHETMTKSLDSCNLCFNSERMLKHTVVTTGSKLYLSVPSTCPLTQDHCILSTIAHIPCQTALDEDFIEELNDFKRRITKMFLKQDKEPVFFETYVNRNKFPHIRIECIPLSSEEASTAPMYFKKALLECETEWANNKKVVEFKKLQKSIPKGLAYFAVEFGTDGGFAHIIEDKNLFPRNFAQEIIGGMTDADPLSWRKPRKRSFEEIHENVTKFQEMWNSC